MGLIGLEEKFVVFNIGVYECWLCGYVYEEVKGDVFYFVVVGIYFCDFLEDWLCFICGVVKLYY